MPNNYYTYINDITEKAIQNPKWFWSDDNTEVRQWFYNNGAGEQIKVIYDNTPENIKQNINPKYLPSDIQSNIIKNKTRDSINDAAPYVGGMMVGATASPYIIGEVANLAVNPIVQTAANVIGAVDGARNAFSKNGISKTYNAIKDEDYKTAALSGLGDVFDIAGTMGLAKYGKQVLTKDVLNKGREILNNGVNKILDPKNLHKTMASIDPTMTRHVNIPTDVEWSQLDDAIRGKNLTRVQDFLNSESYRESIKKVNPNLTEAEIDTFIAAQVQNLNNVKIFTTNSLNPKNSNIKALYNRQNHEIELYNYGANKTKELPHELLHATIKNSETPEGKIVYNNMHYSSNPIIKNGITFDSGFELKNPIENYDSNTQKYIKYFTSDDELRPRILRFKQMLIDTNMDFDHFVRNPKLMKLLPHDVKDLFRFGTLNSVKHLINNTFGVTAGAVATKNLIED